jgi:hypothetical protein
MRPTTPGVDPSAASSMMAHLSSRGRLRLDDADGAVDQISVGAGVEALTDDLFDHGDHEPRYVPTNVLCRPPGRCLQVGLGLRHEAGVLLLPALPAARPQRLGRLVGFVDDGASLRPGLLQRLLVVVLRLLGLGLGCFGVGEGLADDLLAGGYRLVDRRQHIPSQHPEHQQEGDELDDESGIGYQEVARD